MFNDLVAIRNVFIRFSALPRRLRYTVIYLSQLKTIYYTIFSIFRRHETKSTRLYIHTTYTVRRKNNKASTRTSVMY